MLKGVTRMLGGSIEEAPVILCLQDSHLYIKNR